MTQQPRLLRLCTPDQLDLNRRQAVDAGTRAQASEIVERVRSEGTAAVRDFAARFSERTESQPLVLTRADLEHALARLDPETRALLERTASRIHAFAQAQRAAVQPVDVPIPGGRAGHTIEPVDAAGCYAPAGRHPLPSSVLMTAITARVAGCKRVVVASPSIDPVMLASAAIAGADQYLAAGGAHAVAALAFGIDDLEPCDVIVGPGNKWVTAAKQLVSGVVGIDMLAGPSELLVLADDQADPATIASDLLAQAEHDDDAIPMLVTTSEALADRVEQELARQLETLPTAPTATNALRNGFACTASSLDEACAVANSIGAEHLEILTADPDATADRLSNAGALFIGSTSAEVLGDYGAGPNHTLPTGGTSRFKAGLSVMAFLRLRTWMRIDDKAQASPLIEDAASLAKVEGLEAHRRAALARTNTDR